MTCSVEGLSSADGVDGDHLHPLQQTFLEGAAQQCGVCARLPRGRQGTARPQPDPTECEIRYAWRAILPLRLRQDHPLRQEAAVQLGRDVTAIENPRPTSGSAPARSVDSYDKVVGKARFAADLNLPGQLRAAYLRSPHAHANIVSIDTSMAEAMPGVKAVVTGDDFPALDITDPNHDVSINVLARARCCTTAIAAAPPTKAEAQAAAAIEVEYELLPVVLGIDEAMADGAPLANEQNYQKFVGPSDPSNIATHTPLERGDAGVRDGGSRHRDRAQ